MALSRSSGERAATSNPPTATSLALAANSFWDCPRRSWSEGSLCSLAFVLANVGCIDQGCAVCPIPHSFVLKPERLWSSALRLRLIVLPACWCAGCFLSCLIKTSANDSERVA